MSDGIRPECRVRFDAISVDLAEIKAGIQDMSKSLNNGLKTDLSALKTQSHFLWVLLVLILGWITKELWMQ